MDVSMEHLEGVACVLTDKGFAVNYWRRGTPYSDDGVKFCDIFVIILPTMQFKCNVSQLPAGTRKELKLAYNNSKDIYIGYRTADQVYRVYDCNYDEGDSFIAAIGGTAWNICKDHPQDKPAKKEKQPFIPHEENVDSFDPFELLRGPSDYINEYYTDRGKIHLNAPNMAAVVHLDHVDLVAPEKSKPLNYGKDEYDERLLLFYKPSK